MTQEITGVALVAVALVFHPRQIFRLGAGQDFLARYLKQWTQDAEAGTTRESTEYRHASCPADARASQEIEEKGLGLVVLVMSQDQEFRIGFDKSVVAGLTRRCFQATIPLELYIDPPYFERDFPCLAQLLAKCLPLIGIRAEAVVDMQGRQMESMPFRQLAKNMEKKDRIHTARQGGGKTSARPDMQRQAFGRPPEQINGGLAVP